MHNTYTELQTAGLHRVRAEYQQGKETSDKITIWAKLPKFKYTYAHYSIATENYKHTNMVQIHIKLVKALGCYLTHPVKDSQ